MLFHSNHYVIPENELKAFQWCILPGKTEKPGPRAGFSAKHPMIKIYNNACTQILWVRNRYGAVRVPCGGVRFLLKNPGTARTWPGCVMLLGHYEQGIIRVLSPWSGVTEALDIDFIHGYYIHGWSCKKWKYCLFLPQYWPWYNWN